MNDAPERIGLVQNGIGGFALWNREDNKFDPAIEYVRADIARAELEAAVALARDEAYAGGWDDGYAEGFGKAISLAKNVFPAETAYGRGGRARISSIIQPHQADALARVRQEAHNAAIGVKPLVWTHYAADETYPEEPEKPTEPQKPGFEPSREQDPEGHKAWKDAVADWEKATGKDWTPPERVL